MSAPSRRSRPFLDVPPPLLFAHRGGAKLWPENTLVAFEHSLSLGIRYLETDTHLTKDGVLVAHHDADVSGTTDGAGLIADKTYAELAELDAGYHFTEDGSTFPYRGRGLRIPRLLDVFALRSDARVNVEIKSGEKDAPRRLWELVDRNALHDRVLVAAEKDSRVRAFRRLSGGRVATSAGLAESLAFFAASRTGLERLLPLPFDALQIPAVYKGIRVVDRKLVEAARRSSVQIHVWTVDEAHEMRRLLNLGVDGIISDRPDRLISLLRARERYSVSPP